MRCLALLALLLLTSQAFAQLTPAPETVEAEPGEFVAIAFHLATGSKVSVSAPEFLTLMGTPSVKDGHGTVFLYVASYAPAGAHQITLSAPGAVPMALTVFVATRNGIEIQSGGDRSVVQGEPVAMSVSVHNTGNSLEIVEIEARSRLNLRQTRFVLHIGPSETAEVHF